MISIRPYLSLIKAGLGAALICGAFIAGCNHGESNLQQENNDLTAEVEQLSTANKQWALDVEEANKQARANRKFAEEQYKEAQAIGEKLDKQRLKTEKTITNLEQELQEAKKVPLCQSQLEQQLCSAVPVYSLP